MLIVRVTSPDVGERPIAPVLKALREILKEQQPLKGTKMLFQLDTVEAQLLFDAEDSHKVGRPNRAIVVTMFVNMSHPIFSDDSHVEEERLQKACELMSDRFHDDEMVIAVVRVQHLLVTPISRASWTMP